MGIDEVGRGSWAGPLVAGAVILAHDVPGLKDSKKLTRLQRQQLAAEIQLAAVAIGLGWVSPRAIDKGGITSAVKCAMELALAEVTAPYDEIIIDGNYNYFAGNLRARALVGADATVPAVSAASILAKVARDNYMTEVSPEYPDYQFEKHVGYGTAIHLEALKQYGTCDLHRLSYKPVRKINETRS